MTLLSVRGLRVEIGVGANSMVPIDNVSFDVARREVVGIAGESGSGKSLTLKSLVGLLPPDATRTGSVEIDLTGGGLGQYDPAAVRGRGVSFVFQEPMTALNPTMRIGHQIGIGPRVHERLDRRRARLRALELMDDVGIPDPARRFGMWPHELSGGLRQRAMIAIALSTNPQLLLCDEPTTALDVSIQDQILALLLRIRDERGLSIVFVSHDLAVVNELCDRLVVIYAGRVMEAGPTHDVLADPRHPYTTALIGAMPSLSTSGTRLASIPGQPPDPTAYPDGCRFAPRCDHAVDSCRGAAHELTVEGERSTACIRAADLVRR